MAVPQDNPQPPSDAFVVVDRLARIEVKLDEVLKVHADHENRLRAVERWKYALPVTAFTALVSVVLTVIGIYGK